MKSLAPRTLVLALLFLAMMLPAIFNRYPILFPDTFGYFQNGDAELRALGGADNLGTKRTLEMPAGEIPAGEIAAGDNPAGAALPYTPGRSLFYGLPFALLYEWGGAWAMPTLQAVFAIAGLLLALARFGIGRWWREAIAAAIILLTGLNIFVVALMPDLFSGFMLVGSAILIGFSARLRRDETLFWTAAILFALLAHKGHIPVLAVFCASAAVWLAWRREFDPRPFGVLALLVFGAWACHVAYEASVVSRGRQVQNFPFLLARVIGDGTAPLFLDEECGGKAYFVCRYRGQMPMTADEFLWAKEPGKAAFAVAGPADRLRIDREQWPIVTGAVREYPLRQIAATSANAARTLLHLGVGSYAYPIDITEDQQGRLAPLRRAYRNSAFSRHKFPVRAISRWMKLVLAGCAFLLFILACRRPDSLFGGDPSATTRLLLLMGFAANGVVFGTLSGVSDRYQGRILWVLPLVVATVLWDKLHRRAR